MANETFTLIQTITATGGDVGSFSFTGLPTTFTDLVVVGSTRLANSGAYNYSNLTINGSNDGGQVLAAQAGTVSATAPAPFAIPSPGASATGNAFGDFKLYFTNYRNANLNIVSVDAITSNNSASVANFIGSRYLNGVVSSITITPQSGNFTQFSSLSLYGVLKNTGGATIS